MNQNQLSWKQYTRKLRTALTDEDDEDLSFFAEELRGVKIVALGESTHGTREIFELKQRMISYLVRKLGFTVVTIEAGITPSRSIDEYVRYGNGDPGRALSRQRSWTGDTVEVMDLLEWMRSYNQNRLPGEKCRFAGIDMKPLEEVCDNLRKLIFACSIPGRKKALEIIAACRDIQWFQKDSKGLPDVFWLNGWLAVHYHDLKKIYPDETMQYICQFIQSVEKFQSESGKTGYGMRDELMACNIKRILDENPDEKIIVWAQNGHIAIDEKMKSLGWYLRNEFGSLYYSAGIMMGMGGFQFRDHKTMELKSFRINEPDPETWEAELNESLEKKNWYIQIRKGCTRSKSFNEWAMREKPVQLSGSIYNDDPTDERYKKFYSFPIPIGEHYDGLFFLGQVKRARLNPIYQR